MAAFTRNESSNVIGSVKIVEVAPPAAADGGGDFAILVDLSVKASNAKRYCGFADDKASCHC